ncbi:hypothetical protein AVEN_211563-1 [Araneus ventricosus]|uniref:Uncharacterized protein n=1 Tax=Araneus ventricosus TaxID=182803 RepID=A0A4Y2D8R4_ARAVE|nr:hypothetical protein AVEN_211563-1 [Araneus ventricosus]
MFICTLKSQKHWYRHAYANKEIWNQSEYGSAVGNSYIRQQVSGIVVRSVTATTIASYQDLREFERGIIVGAREMGHSISKVAMKFGFSREIWKSTTSPLPEEYHARTEPTTTDENH